MRKVSAYQHIAVLITMALTSGPRKLRCDCASAFDTPQSFGEHVQKTGHVKHRWCTLCNRLFGSKEAAEQHKKTAEKHKKKPAVLPKTNASVTNKKPQVGKPKPAPKKPAPVPKPPKTAAKTVVNASAKAKEKNKTTKNPIKNPIATVSNTIRPAVVSRSSFSTQAAPVAEPLNPLAKDYPWASGRQAAGLIMAATAQCHSEGRLLEQGYYTGDPAYRGGQKFSIRLFVSTPARAKGLVKRKAIALDCEMVGTGGGNDELAHLCAVDLFTGEVLINTLVAPTQPVRDWRTRWSGVTAAKMAMAKASGNILDGWPAAREKLFEFADADTILVGHALNHDLRVLYIAHRKVIDSGVVVAEAVFGRAQRLWRCWGLKHASQELLHIKIQASKSGHDCLEDTFASRELVLLCLNEPEKLSEWGKNALAKWEEESRKIEERKKAKEKAKKEKEEKEMGISKENEKLPVFGWSPAVVRSGGERDDDYDNDYDEGYHDKYYDDDYDYDYSQLHGSGYIGGLRAYSGVFHNNFQSWLEKDDSLPSY